MWLKSILLFITIPQCPSLPFPRYLKPSLPSHILLISPHLKNATGRFKRRRVQRNICIRLRRGRKSSGWTGGEGADITNKWGKSLWYRCRHTHTHSFTKALQCYILCMHCGHTHTHSHKHTNTHTRSFGVYPVSQDTILKHSESVLPTPIVREKADRMVTGICSVFSWILKWTWIKTGHLPHTLFANHLIGSLLPLYIISPPLVDLQSVCLYLFFSLVELWRGSLIGLRWQEGGAFSLQCPSDRTQDTI